jgi:hypothetical protein
MNLYGKVGHLGHLDLSIHTACIRTPAAPAELAKRAVCGSDMKYPQTPSLNRNDFSLPQKSPSGRGAGEAFSLFYDR